jgi:hypothetical protein
MSLVMRSIRPADTIDLLERWLTRAASAESIQWLRAEIERQRASSDERRLGMALGLCPRRIGRADLNLSAEDMLEAQSMHRRWRPDTWSTDEAARTALVLSTWRDHDASFAALIDRVCERADLGELVACLKGFALFPAPERLYARAREALRSSAQPVFEAIARNNPYPADRLDEPAYNQMVVKCIFTGVSILEIVGLDERRNADLTKMLRDLVSERQAAGRTLPLPVHQWIGEDA